MSERSALPRLPDLLGLPRILHLQPAGQRAPEGWPAGAPQHLWGAPEPLLQVGSAITFQIVLDGMCALTMLKDSFTTQVCRLADQGGTKANARRTLVADCPQKVLVVYYCCHRLHFAHISQC